MLTQHPLSSEGCTPSSTCCAFNPSPVLQTKHDLLVSEHSINASCAAGSLSLRPSMRQMAYVLKNIPSVRRGGKGHIHLQQRVYVKTRSL